MILGEGIDCTGGSCFRVDGMQDSPACAGSADTSTLWVLEHKLVSSLPISDYRSYPKSLEKRLSNLLTTLRYKSRNVNQFLASMNHVCKRKMKVFHLLLPQAQHQNLKAYFSEKMERVYGS